MSYRHDTSFGTQDSLDDWRHHPSAVSSVGRSRVDFLNVIVDGSSRGFYLHTGAHRGDTLQNIPLMRSRQCIKSQSLSFVHYIAVSFYTPLK